MSIEFSFQRGTQVLRLTKQPLRLRYSPVGYFQALVAGESSEGKPDDHFLYFGPLRYVLGTPDGPVIGFQLLDLDSFEPDQFPDATYGPRFDVPELGLEHADVGDIVHAAQRAFTSTTEAQIQ